MTTLTKEELEAIEKDTQIDNLEKDFIEAVGDDEVVTKEEGMENEV